MARKKEDPDVGEIEDDDDVVHDVDDTTAPPMAPMLDKNHSHA